jgi:hypothetical protein
MHCYPEPDALLALLNCMLGKRPDHEQGNTDVLLVRVTCGHPYHMRTAKNQKRQSDAHLNTHSSLNSTDHLGGGAHLLLASSPLGRVHCSSIRQRTARQTPVDDGKSMHCGRTACRLCVVYNFAHNTDEPPGSSDL